MYLSYAVEIKVGKDEEDDDALLFGRVVRFRPTIIFKGEFEGRVHKECKRINRSVPRVVCTVLKYPCNPPPPPRETVTWRPSPPPTRETVAC